MVEDADGRGPQAGDGSSEFARALASACTLGSAILSRMAEQSEVTRAAAALAPLIEPLRRTGGAATNASMARDGVEIAGFLGQTWMVAAASSVRYWERLAQFMAGTRPPCCRRL